MRRRGALVAVIATTLVIAPTPLASETEKDPSALILRRADMPRGAQYQFGDGADDYLDDALDRAGVTMEAARFLGTSSNTKGFLQISGVVITTPSPAQAKRGFVAAKKAHDTFRRGSRLPRVTPIALASFGDQQLAQIVSADSSSSRAVEVLVRKNSVLWLLYVGLDRRPRPPKAELVAELKRYAAKQKTRVGAG